MEDLPAIEKIELSSQVVPWSRESIEIELRSAISISLVCESTTIAGFLFASFIHDESEIRNVVVAADQRRRGVGSALMNALIAATRERGGIRVLLDVNCENQPALAMYRRFGFQIISQKKRYYRSSDDALVMSLALS